MRNAITRISSPFWGLLIFSILASAAPGDLDLTFGGSGSVGIFANTIPIHVRVRDDGKIVTLGDYPYGDISYISRNNANGQADLGFGVAGLLVNDYSSGEVLHDIAFLPDGRFLIVGQKAEAFALFRYNPNGNRDFTFGINGVMTPPVGNAVQSTGNSIVLQNDGKIIAAGNFGIVRYHADGSPDASFGNGGLVVPGPENLGKLILQPDGKILAWTFGYPVKVIRFNQNGTFDTNFGTAGILTPAIDYAQAWALSRDGKIVISGRMANLQTTISRFDQNGHLDMSFGTNGSVSVTEPLGNSSSFGRAQSIAVQQNGKVVIAGDINSVFSVARFNVNGSIDETFGTNGSVVTPFAPICRFFDITIQSDGRIVAVGDAGSPNTAQFVGLVRYIGDPPPVTITGKVLTPDGRGLRSSGVVLTDEAGERQIVTTSSFGNYAFSGIEAGRQYTVSVVSKRYRFQVRTITPSSNLTGFDLVGQE